MTKLLSILGICMFFLIGLISFCFAQEELTITTYYPSPYGDYNELRTHNNTYLATDAGNVGIGTTVPEDKLDIANGSIRLDNGEAVKWGNGTTGITANTSASPYVLGFEVNGERMRINSNGNVGMGTASPSYPLHMGSGAYCSAAGVWTDASSRTYKKDIVSLSLSKALATLSGLKPVIFKYKLAPDEQHVGFIAEEVPELVATKDRKGLSSMDIVAVLTKVVQQQQREIEGLKDELEARIKALESKINN